jgi:hypothetical protein
MNTTVPLVNDVVLQVFSTGVKWQPSHIEEEFGEAKVVIRICISKKNRQHNGQKKKYKRTNNDLSQESEWCCICVVAVYASVAMVFRWYFIGVTVKLFVCPSPTLFMAKI